MAKILQMPVATTAPQDVLKEDAATFEVLRQMREDILCCALKPDQRLRFGELRQRYETSVGTLREALSHLVSEGLARTEAGRGFSVAPVSLADFLDLSELRIYLETRTLADAIHHGTDRQFRLPRRTERQPDSQTNQDTASQTLERLRVPGTMC